MLSTILITGRKVVITLAIMLLIPISVFAVNTVLTGFHITGTQVYLDAHGVCKAVSSNNGNEYFAPTKTAAEWQSFRANAPVGVDFAECFVCGTTVSYGGQSYDTVEIGTQCWFAKNLNIGTKLASGGTDPNTSNSTIEKWCYDNSDANCTSDGGLYSWDEAMHNGYANSSGVDICPVGWHIATDIEYKTLEMHLGMSQTQADATGWRGTDEGTKIRSSPFNAPLTGYRYTDGSFYFRGMNTNFWSSTENGINVWIRTLRSNYTSVYRGASSKMGGSSVRCIKD